MYICSVDSAALSFKILPAQLKASCHFKPCFLGVAKRVGRSGAASERLQHP